MDRRARGRSSRGAARRRPALALLLRRRGGVRRSRSRVRGRRPTTRRRRATSTSSSSSASARTSRQRSPRSRTRRRAPSSCTAWAARTARARSSRCCCTSPASTTQQIAADYAAERGAAAPAARGVARRGGDGSRARADQARSPPRPPTSMLGVLDGARATLRQRRGLPSRARRRATRSSSSCASASVADAVLAIYGPTASGKTAVAEAVTRRIPAEVVSADAAALFRGLEVLTAAPEYPARLVGVFDVEHDVSVGEFQRLAHEAIDDVLAHGRTPIVVGGTGLYLRAALVRPRASAASRADGARGAGRRSTTSTAACTRTGGCRRSIPKPPRACTRTTAAASCARSSLRRRASTLAGDDLWSGETRHPTLSSGSTFPTTCSSSGFARAPRRCSSAASSTRRARRSHVRCRDRRAR